MNKNKNIYHLYTESTINVQSKSLKVTYKFISFEYIDIK